MSKISIKINGKEFITETGKRIIDVVRENGIEIPSLCFHPDIEDQGHCGICIVKISGEDGFKNACSTFVKENIEITTESEDIQEERKRNLEKILDNHVLECGDCVLFQRCKLLELARAFNLKPTGTKKEDDKVFEVGEMVFDQTKCIGCGNCVSVCPVDFLHLNEKNKVTPSSDEKKDCINCGQCILHCPVGAIEGVGEFESLEKNFLDNGKTVVVQFAPSIRTSIGEEFGLSAGEIVTEKLVAGLKKVGFDYVFDTAVGADFTTMEESDELIERLTKNEKLPGFTSCCPAWVKFLEFNYPEFTPNLCTSRSPQVMLGSIVKSYWSSKKNIDPKDIFVVSVMPCVAKKHEIKREKLGDSGLFAVDMVLTTRELARLFKKKGIDLKNIDGEKIDDPLCSPSGAGVIYGSSGGVFESAFRTAYFKMMGEELPEDAIKEIRGQESIKVKEISFGDRKIKLCVVSGIKNAEKVIKEIKNNPGIYDVVEVMACPGGCVGGGGQPIPTTSEIVKKRADSLYSIDNAGDTKRAHENPIVKKIYEEFFNNMEIRKELLHTEFSKREKSKIDVINDSKETV